MKAIVTGGAGFVGSHIVESLINQGARVLVVDDMSTGQPSNLNGDIDVVNLGINDAKVAQVFLQFKPDLVSHCAAQASVPFSVKNPIVDSHINILGGLNVFQSAIKAKCSQIIYINTGGALYGNPAYLPCDENHPISPISPYALSKWTLEQYLKLISPSSLNLQVLRLANVFGPKQSIKGESGVIGIFSQNMIHMQPVTIFGDGDQTRDFIYVEDVANAHALAVNSPSSFTVNIGSGNPTSINTIFQIIAEKTNYTEHPIYSNSRSGDVNHIYLDIKKANELLGWKPQTSLDDGLNKTLKWFLKQK
jgi:UDP-glucose 4-epimerase